MKIAALALLALIPTSAMARPACDRLETQAALHGTDRATLLFAQWHTQHALDSRLAGDKREAAKSLHALIDLRARDEAAVEWAACETGIRERWPTRQAAPRRSPEIMNCVTIGIATTCTGD